jgi:acyl-CoA thioesterase FadM
MVTATQVMVLIRRHDRRPTPIPQSIRERIDAFERAGD